MSDREVRKYLAKAAHADRLAAALDDPFSRETWADIAKGYRELAELTTVEARKREVRDVDAR